MTYEQDKIDILASAKRQLFEGDSSLHEYIGMLIKHDWSHEMSDDFSVRNRGRDAYNRLREVQRAKDPNFAVWNVFCACGYEVPEPPKL